MADWNKPTETSDYESFPDEVREIAKSAAKMNYVSDSDTNLFDGMLLYNRSTKRFQQRESGVWVDKELTNLAADSVGTYQVQNLAITDAKIANDTISESKLTADAASRSTLLGSFSYYLLTFGSVGVLMPVPETRGYFAGGFAAAQVNKITIPKAAKVTHLSMDLSASPGSGNSISVDLGVESSYTLTPLTISGLTNVSGSSVVSKAVTAGQRLEATLSSAGLAQDTSVVFKVWGHFTE